MASKDDPSKTIRVIIQFNSPPKTRAEQIISIVPDTIGALAKLIPFL